MPWTARDAKRHDKAANTPKKRRQWSDVADSMLKRGYSEGRAIRAANSVVGRSKRRGRRSKR
jgi:uncharacterized protein YdaT